MNRIVRRLRLIEYVGPEEWVNLQVNRRTVKGEVTINDLSYGKVYIREALLGDTNELIYTSHSAETEEVRNECS